jgi:hypothetical protein
LTYTILSYTAINAVGTEGVRTEIVRISKVSFGAFADIDILVVMSRPISIPPMAESSEEGHMLRDSKYEGCADHQCW